MGTTIIVMVLVNDYIHRVKVIKGQYTSEFMVCEMLARYNVLG